MSTGTDGNEEAYCEDQRHTDDPNEPLSDQEIAMIFLRWLQKEGPNLSTIWRGYKTGDWAASNIGMTVLRSHTAESLARKLMEEMK